MCHFQGKLWSPWLQHLCEGLHHVWYFLLETVLYCRVAKIYCWFVGSTGFHHLYKSTSTRMSGLQELNPYDQERCLTIYQTALTTVVLEKREGRPVLCLFPLELDNSVNMWRFLSKFKDSYADRTSPDGQKIPVSNLLFIRQRLRSLCCRLRISWRWLG